MKRRLTIISFIFVLSSTMVLIPTFNASKDIQMCTDGRTQTTMYHEKDCIVTCENGTYPSIPQICCNEGITTEISGDTTKFVCIDYAYITIEQIIEQEKINTLYIFIIAGFILTLFIIILVWINIKKYKKRIK